MIISDLLYILFVACQKAEDVLEAAKKQTIYEVLLNAMASAKTKLSLELPKDSLYEELKTKTRAMPDDVKVNRTRHIKVVTVNLLLGNVGSNARSRG